MFDGMETEASQRLLTPLNERKLIIVTSLSGAKRVGDDEVNRNME